MNEIVYRGEGNRPLTNSKLVAEVFGKPHDNVLKAIRELSCIHYESRWFHSAGDGIQWQEGDGVQTEIHRSLQRYEETDWTIQSIRSPELSRSSQISGQG